ncbi:HoxN/HupN/NixA family nickel/cobalt transporter [Rhodococcus sp. NPDC127528]|uniref:HoxN/HupN/NixA family nickel/cobalt transporter n=1 Tax=unclassified Rhodococcus (in: high G+C Gram-positive bacteria) TaxID=192944 RepID=UPI00362AF0D4
MSVHAGGGILRFASSERREKASPRLRLGITFGVVGALHLVGFGLAFSQGLRGLAGGLTIGMVGTAYLAGLKHQADADHISAIDNATRKFIADGRRPVSVGLAFSLGHSTIVAVASLLVVLGVRGMDRTFEGESPVAGVLGLTGSMVAGSFLVLIGLVNTVVLRGILRGGAGNGSVSSPPTFVGRLMARPLGRVTYPRHVFVIGALFGLGFDTASLIGLLVLAGTSAASGVATISLLALPVCFAAGMTLGDSLNGIAMMRLYSSASDGSRRRRSFNVLITTMSVVSAFGIGITILVSAVRDAFALHDPVTGFFSALNLEYVGIAMIGAFGVMWIATEASVRRADP